MGGGRLNKGFAISGILYPILILTVFLMIQLLTILGTRKVVLDQNSKRLLETVNSGNKVYTNEELSTIITDLEARIDSLTTENASLKTEMNSVKSNLSNNYVTKVAMKNPANQIKSSIMGIFDGGMDSTADPSTKMFARNSNSTPNDYKKVTSDSEGEIYAELKYAYAIGLTGTTQNRYAVLITINNYGSTSDFTAGQSIQFAFMDSSIHKRISTSATQWGSWTKLH